jgi:hypothetical protein
MKIMTREDKELLSKDLSARLPYNVIVDYSYNAFDVHNGNYVKHGSKCLLRCYLLDVFMSPRQNEKGEYIKPYLRPLSSMTKEERIELSNYENTIQRADFFYSHHLDPRNLIEKGLALPAPDGMYNN